MSTQTTRPTMTREEIEAVISDIIGERNIEITCYGDSSGDPSKIYGWIYGSEDEHPYRSETTDAPFDPEAEGWEPGTKLSWTKPGTKWRILDLGGLWELRDRRDDNDDPYYSGKHPTTELVNEIIRLNGGDSE